MTGATGALGLALRLLLAAVGVAWAVFLAFFGSFVLIRLWPTWYYFVPMAAFILAIMALPLYGSFKSWRWPLAGSLIVATSGALFAAPFIVLPVAIPGLDTHGYSVRFGFLVLAVAASVVFVGLIAQGPGEGITHTAASLLHVGHAGHGHDDHEGEYGFDEYDLDEELGEDFGEEEFEPEMPGARDLDDPDPADGFDGVATRRRR